MNARDAEIRARETGWRGIALENPPAKPSFVLDAADGRPFDFRAETDGYTTFLFFGYTSCPDVCPVHMASLAAVKRDLNADDQRAMRVIFVTADPRRDTPERPHAPGRDGDARDHRRPDLPRQVVEPEQQPGPFESLEEVRDRRRLRHVAELVDERRRGRLEERAADLTGGAEAEDYQYDDE